MRKLIFLIGFFLVFVKLSFGQFTNGPTQDNAQTLRQFDGGTKHLLALIPPTLDTLNNPAATYYGALTTSPLYPGKLFMSIQTKWVEVSGSTNISFPGTTGKYLTGYNNVFGTLNTDSITEAGKLFYTTARARSAISALLPMSYNSTTGVLTVDTITYLATKTDVTSGIGGRWGVLGNAGTTSLNFIGTTDNVPLRFKVNSSPYGFIGSNTNTAIGFNTLHSLLNPIFNDNTAFGYSALGATTNGTDNTAVGYNALALNTSGLFNSAFGKGALAANTSGISNTGIGLNALASTNTGSFNTALGTGALSLNTTGYNNVATGVNSLPVNTTGVYNSSYGVQSMNLNTTGSFNTSVGDSALGSQTTATKNVALGHGAGYNEITSNKLYISNSTTTSPLIYGNFSNPNVSINSGATADTSTAVLSIRSTTKGVLFPRLNTTQMNAISSPATGLMIWQTDSASLCQWNGSVWQNLRGPGGGGGGGGSGTVTNIATGYGLSGGPATVTATFIWDSATAFLTALRRVDSTLYTTVYQNSLKQNALTLTTTGTSGASTLVGSTLNIPQYAGGSPNVNVGAAYRLTFPLTNNVRTIDSGYAINIDSTSTANALKFRADTLKVATRARVAQAIGDSNAANTFTIAHAGMSAGYDSLVYIIDAHNIKFVKLTGGSSPIILTQGSDTSIGFSMPSYVPASGKILTLSNSLTLAGTDGTVMTFPSSSTTVAGLSTANVFINDNSFTSSSATNNTINRMRSGTDNANSNFVFQSPASISNQTDSRSVPTGIAGLSYRVNFAGVNSTMTADYIYANVNIAKVGVTSAASGTTRGATNLLVQTPPYTNSGARTNSLSNVYIYGKPSYTDADTVASLFVKGTVLITDTAKGLTVSSTDNSTILATTAMVQSAISAGSGATTQALEIYNDLGGTTVAEGFLSIGNITNTNTFSTGCRVTLIRVPVSSTVLTGITYDVLTAFSGTATAYNGFGLYSYNSSTGLCTLVASSTNDGTIWSGTGWAKKAFSSPYTAAAGTYVVVSSYNASVVTTNPIIASGAALVATSVPSSDFTNSAKMNGSTTAITSLPATFNMSTVTLAMAQYYFAGYQ